MGHDATKVQLGTSQSSNKSIDNLVGDPATLKAGFAVSLKEDGSISLAKADGARIGISMGVSQSDTKRTAVARSGLRIPVALTAAFAPVVGAAVSVSDTTGAAIASGPGATVINAVYATGALTAINEDGTETVAAVALIDMPGGV